MDEIMKIKLEMMRLDWDIEEIDIVVSQSKNFVI
jgi:DNA polymerase III alpha subunit (gram-positive type)